MRRSRISQEEGSGTVYALAVLLAILTVALLLGGLARSQAAAARARSAADLAALSAARALTAPASGLEPCAVAATVAQAQGARTVSCWDDGEDVELVVSVPVRVLGARREAQARSRAGPVSSAPRDRPPVPQGRRPGAAGAG